MSNTVTFPTDKFLRCAGMWVSMYSVFMLFNASGLSQSGVVSSGYKAALTGLSCGGSVFLIQSLLGWYEQKVSRLPALRMAVVDRIVRVVLVILCIAMPVGMYLTDSGSSNTKSHCATLNQAEQVFSALSVQFSMKG